MSILRDDHSKKHNKRVYVSVHTCVYVYVVCIVHTQAGQKRELK